MDIPLKSELFECRNYNHAPLSVLRLKS